MSKEQCTWSMLCCTLADSRFAPSQLETALLRNDVSHWLGASLESALCLDQDVTSQALDAEEAILQNLGEMDHMNRLRTDNITTK